jgi:hypothetical protein
MTSDLIGVTGVAFVADFTSSKEKYGEFQEERDNFISTHLQDLLLRRR